jgi:hypothetical protein
MSPTTDVWLSPFIFTGQVRKRRSATLSLVDVTEFDAVIAVERVLRRPEGVVDFSGQDVTLRGNSAVELDDGRTALFAANGWLYGESLALIEVARMDGSQSSAEKRIKDAEKQAALDAMRDRLRRADLVVVAVVEKTNPLGGKEVPPASEHDPQWWEAWLEVESVEKGKPPRRLRVLYPNSIDEFWAESPKFKPKDAGVFLLQRNQQERGPTQYRMRGYTALDPLDFQPREPLDELRRLLRR